MYEILILSTLAHGPMHGYKIAKVLENIMGPFRQVQWGSLYPVLSRLQEDGLICAEEREGEDVRQRKVYQITDAGRDRLHEQMMNTERHLGEYDALFGHKVAHFHLLCPEERTYLCRHYTVYAQQNSDHLNRRRPSIESAPHLSPEEKADILELMDHRIDYWKSERAWAEKLIAREEAKEAS